MPKTLGELLRPRELSVVQAAIHSRTEFGIENYLCSTGQNRSAELLIARGFLTEINQIGLEGWGLVVTITNDNIAAINAELAL